MPLFCTLANQFTTTTTPDPNIFESKGHPLMFETINKHMFFVDPGDTTKTVQKFYGAPLSVYHLFSNTNGGIFPINTDYHTHIWGYLPAGNINNIATAKLSFGSRFGIISEILVNDHKINAKYAALQLPTETKLSLSRSTSSITPKHGESFDVISSLSVSNHAITPTYTTVNLPESYLYTSAFTTIVVGPNNTRFKKHAGANLKLTNETNFITLLSGENIGIISGNEYNNQQYVSIGNEVGNTVTISATNNHSVTHGAEMVTASASTNGKTINLTNINETGDDDLKLFSIIPGTNVSMEFNENNRDITINASNTHAVTHVFTASNVSTNNISMHLTNATTDGNYAPLNIKGGTGISITGSGDTVTITNSSTNTDYTVQTNTSDSTVYLSGKTIVKSGDIGIEYINSKVYMKSGVLYSNNERVISVKEADGVVEVGKYLDFHTSGHYGNNSNEEDYAARLQDLAGSHRDITLPANSGTLPVSNNHSSNSANILVTDIRVVTALPSDAANYPNTLFLVTGGG